MKNGDVYIFTPKDYKNWSNHCFDGYLVYMDGIYCDTYWGGKRSSYSRVFTQTQLDKVGTIEFYCNLDELESIKKFELGYYKKEDIRYIPEQHGCYPHYYILKGSKKDKNSILSNINEKIQETQRRLEYKQRELEALLTTKKEVEEGNLNIYF